MKDHFFSRQEIANTMIDKMEKPLVSIGAELFNHIAKPTLENCFEHNSRELILLRDWFMEHDVNDSRMAVWETLFNALVIKIERRDRYYTFRFDQLIKKIKTMEWEYRGKDTGHPFWKDD